MNKHLYRLIFNQRRGQLMVVGENAPSQGKQAAGGGAANGSGDAGGGAASVIARLRPVALAVFATLGMVLFVSGPALGQIVGDPNAPGKQRPTIVQSANGTTQVNIQTPSAAGVSRNTYSQFDVGPGGAILNNSRNAVQTQTGGWVQGNPWLAGGSARVILNEVNSSNPSQLRGYVEVAGQRAEVVIANPAGMAIDGGGFINASRVVLTTGTPVLSNGVLDGYTVQRGTITVNGRGLDVSQTDYAAILARAVQLNGGIWGKDLKVVTGANGIDAQHAVTASVAGTGAAPAFALDASQLGGMYAGKITLIGTEAGLGVRNAGTLAASAGKLVLQSNGWLSNSGTLYANGDAALRTDGNLANTGLIGAHDNLDVAATGAAASVDIAAGAVIAAGLNNDNSVRQGGDLQIAASGRVTVHGHGAAGGALHVDAADIDVVGGSMTAAALGLQAGAGSLDASRAVIAAAGELSLQARDVLRTDGAEVSAGRLALAAHDLSNIGGRIAQSGADDLSIALPGQLDNTGGRIASNGRNLDIGAAGLRNADGKIEHAGTGTLTLNVAGALTGPRGHLIGNGALAVQAGTLDNAGGTLAAARDLSLKAGDVDNTRGTIQALAGQATLHSADFDNVSGNLYAGAGLHLTADNLANTGSIYSGNDADITLRGALASSGDLSAAGHAVIRAQQISSAAGSVLGAGVRADGSLGEAGDLVVAAAQTLSSHGQTLAGGRATMTGTALDLDHSQIAAGNLDLLASAGNVTTRGASLTAAGTLSITANTQGGQLLVNTGGAQLTAGQLALQVANLDNSGGAIVQTGSGDTVLATGILDNGDGRIVSNSANLTLQASMLTNSGRIEHVGAATLQIDAGTLHNGGAVVSAGNVDTRAAAFDNRGSVYAAGWQQVHVSGVLDNTGTIVAGSDNRIRAAGIASSARSVLAAGIKADGKVGNGGDLRLEASDALAASGQNLAGGTFAATGAAIDLRGSQTGAAQAELTATAGAISTAEAVVSTQGALTLTAAGAIDNRHGTLQSTTAGVRLAGASVDNTLGVMSAGTDLQATVRGNVDNGGTAYAGAGQRWTVGGALVNSGAMTALGDLALDATGAITSGGRIAASGQVALRGAALDLSGGQLAAHGVALTALQGDVTTSGATVGATGLLSITANARNGQTLVNTAKGQLGAGQLALHVANLDNRDGEILQSGQGDTAIATGVLDNRNGRIAVNSDKLGIEAATLRNSGRIEHAGAGQLTIRAGLVDGDHGAIIGNGDLALAAATVRNGDGVLAAARQAAISVDGRLDNSAGSITAGAGLQLSAQQLDNLGGKVQAADQVALRVAALDNTGSILAGAGLDTQAGRMHNSGSLYTAGWQRMQVDGTLDNAGVIAARGDNRIEAGSIASTATSLLGAGIAADGRVGSAGALTVTATQALAAHGQNLAAGPLGMQAAMIDLSASQTGAASMALRASAGDIVTTGASIVSTELLQVDAGAHNLHNGLGVISAGQLDIAAGQLANQGGKLLQTGAGVAAIAVQGLLDNRAGGELAANGELQLQAQALANSDGGRITSTASMTLDVQGPLDNVGATIAASHNVNLRAGSIDNSAGRVQASSGDLLLDGAQVHNAQGVLSAGRDVLAAVAGEVSNSGTVYAGRDQRWSTGGALTNTGSMAALGDLALTAAATLTASGQQMAGGQASLRAATLDLRDSQTGARTIELTASAGDIMTARAVVNAEGLLAITASARNGQALINDSGRLSAGQLRADVGRLDNAGGTMAQTGSGTLDLHVRAQLDNTGGTIASNGALALTAGAVNNGQGMLSALQDTAVVTGGALDNTHGALLAGQSLSVTAGQLDNIDGKVQALAGAATLRLDQLRNTGTVYAATHLGTQAVEVSNTGSLYAAGGQQLQVAGLLDNSGVIAAHGDTTISADNVRSSAQSLLGAGVGVDGSVGTSGKLAVTAVQGLLANGQNLAGGHAALTGGSLDVHGSQTSAASIDLLATHGDIVTTGATVAAAGLLSVTAAGAQQQLQNTGGTLSAGQLALDIGQLANHGGKILQTGTGDAVLDVAGRLDNAGGELAVNGALALHAASIDNGSGRITATRTLAVDVDGALHNAGGTVAASDAVSVTAGLLDNSSGTLQATNGKLVLDVANLANVQGVLSAGTDLLADVSADAANSGLSYAGRDQHWRVVGALTNSGSLAAGGHTTVQADRITSSGLLGAGVRADGQIAGGGDLTLTANTALTAGGQNLAAGTATLQGTTLDLAGSQTSANRLALTATQGQVMTSGAAVNASGLLTITANANQGQALVNTAQGQLTAGQLDLHVANLDNRDGQLVQTGQGNTVIATGVLDNRNGRIAVNSGDLGLEAVTLYNSGRIEHAGNGVLAIAASALHGQGGAIIGNGAVRIDAEALDHRNAQLVALQVTLQSDRLDNRGGSIGQLGADALTLQVADTLDNSGGKIESNGALLLTAGAIANQQGVLSAARDAALTADRSLDNSGGTVVAGQQLTLSGGRLDNVDGTVQALSGDATFDLHVLNNTGRIATGANLRATAGTVYNSGSLYAAGWQQWQAAGLLENSGVMASRGDTTITAHSVHSGGQSLLGAGIGADGSVVAGGKLAVTAAQALVANGQNLAGGHAALAGASLDVQGSQTSAASIDLLATHGDINTAAARVSTSGVLTVHANAQPQQTVYNAGGMLSAGQIAMLAGQLDNRGGKVLQMGDGSAEIAVIGKLDNSGGELAANGAMRVQAGSIVNSKQGSITAHASLALGSEAALDNVGGLIAATGDIAIAAAALENGQGTVQAHSGNLVLAAGRLDNLQGVLSAGQDLRATVAGDASNGGLSYAGHDQQWTVGGTLNNTGSLAALGVTTLTAHSITSSGLLGAGIKLDGSLAPDGKLTLTATHGVTATGQNLAAGQLAVRGASVDLSTSQTSALGIDITATQGKVVTSAATISTPGTLAIAANAEASQGLENTGGAQLSAGQLDLNVANLDNRGGAIVQTGQGDTVIHTGMLNNNGGTIAVNSANLGLEADALYNSGRIDHAGSGTLTIATGALHGQGGTIVGNNGLHIEADSVDHRDAQLLARQATLQAGTLDNRNGSIGQAGSGAMVVNVAAVLDNAGGRIESNGELKLDADTMLNGHGLLSAAQQAVVTVAGTLDNSGGIVSAGQDLRLQAATLDNLAGKVQALGGHAHLQVQQLNNSGSVFAEGSLTMRGNTVHNSGSLYAAGSQQWQLAGVLDNSGVMAAGGDNTIIAASIGGTATSLFAAGVKADGSLTGAGQLGMTAAGALASHGQVLAAGQATLTGAALDLAGSEASAGSLALQATAGAIATSDALITTAGRLTVEARALDNARGVLSAGELAIEVDDLGNQAGKLLQTGAGTAHVLARGLLDNSAGGELASSGHLQVDAGAVDNSDGRMTAAGTLELTSATSLTSTAGTVAASRDVVLKAAAIANADGIVQAGAGTLRIEAGSIDNANGVLNAGSDIVATVSGNVRNSGVSYAGRDQQWQVDGSFANSGSLAAFQNTSLHARDISSSGLLGAGVRGDGSLGAAGALALTANAALTTTGQNLAAEQLRMRGAVVDLSGSQTAAADIDLSATVGNVVTSRAMVNTSGLLAISANAGSDQALVNGGNGQLTAGQLALQVANLDNAGGSIVQTGAGATAITTGVLDNNNGRIAVNSADLSLTAATLHNSGRIEHAGSGVLAITAAALNGQGGAIIGNGVLEVNAGSLDHRNAQMVAQHLHVQADSLDNRAGHLLQTGTAQGEIAVRGALTNAQGEIGSNGSLLLHAGALDNSAGQIATNGALAVTAETTLLNDNGTVAAARDMSVAAATLDNGRGSIRAVGGNLTLEAGDLRNIDGSLYAGQALRATVRDVRNSGSLYAAGSQTIEASGTVENSGVIAAAGDTAIRGASVVSTGAASLLGAGVGADGTLLGAARLTVTASGNVQASGQQLASGSATLSGAALDLGGTTGAVDLTLSASGGNVTTSNAVVTATGTLVIGAGTQAGQSWVNRNGMVSAGQLAVSAANVDNRSGTVIQTGTGDGAIRLTSASGVFDNSGGRLAINSSNFTVAANTLRNNAGSFEHASTGLFAINAANFLGEGGAITSNGTLSLAGGAFTHAGAHTVARQLLVDVATLDNAGGSFTQLGSAAGAVKIAGAFNNSGGVLASNGALTVTAGALDNRGGAVQVGGSAQLVLAIDGKLDNGSLADGARGSIAAGGNAIITADQLANQQGRITAGGSLDVTVAHGVHNAGGLLAATGDVTLAAMTLDNAGGTVASVTGAMQATTSGATNNAGGVLQAAGAIVLDNGGLVNRDGGVVSGRTVQIDSHGQALDNHAGTVAAAQSLTVRTGAIDNAGGRLQASGALSLNTAGQLLDNTHGGTITSGGTTTLATGRFANAGGYLGAAGAIGGSVGQMDNTAGGLIVSQSGLALSVTGLNNQGGQVQAVGDLALHATGTIANQQGLIRSGGTVALDAAAIDNGDTRVSNQGIEGFNLDLTTASLSNQQGALRADNNLTVTSGGTLNNSQGLFSAGNTLVLRDSGAAASLAIQNTAGTAIAGRSLQVRAASLGGDGSLLSQQNLALDLAGDYRVDQGGQITANGNASLVIGGHLANAGVLQAGGVLDVRAASLDNAASGDIHAGTTRVTTTTTLDNRGLIDGGTTEVNAGTLNNVGTGRIYGDHLSVAAGILDNNVEGGKAGVLAARERLDIGAQVINNNEHALIFSAGDMAIGGALGANRVAMGQAQALTNASAEIEALGNLRIDAGRIDNLNKHFTLQLGANSVEEILEYQIDGQEYRQQFEPTPYCMGSACDRRNSRTFTYTEYGYTRTTTNSTVLSSDPGKIVAGGSLVITAGQVVNENSHILAGGLLSITPGALVNKSTESVSKVVETGYAAHYRLPEEVGGGMDVAEYTPEYLGREVYQREETGVASAVSGGRVEGNTAVATSGSRPGALAGVGAIAGTSGAAQAVAGVSLAAVAPGTVAVAGVGSASAQAAGTAAGADRLHATDRAGGAGQGGSVAVGTGASASAVNHSGDGVRAAAWTMSQADTAVHGTAAASTAQMDTNAIAVNAVAGTTSDTVQPGAVANSSVQAQALAQAASNGGPKQSAGGGIIGRSSHSGLAGQAGAMAGVRGDAVTVPAQGGETVIDADRFDGVVNTRAPGAIAGVGGIQASDRTGNAAAGGTAQAVDAQPHPAGIDIRSLQQAADSNNPAHTTGLDGMTRTQRADGTHAATGYAAAATRALLDDAQVDRMVGTSAAPTGAPVGDSTTRPVTAGAALPATGAAPGNAGVPGTRAQAASTVALNNPAGSAQVVRTSNGAPQLPTASLFTVSPSPEARYLVETDARFSNYREWTGSDYMLSQVQLDPTVTQKRLGDGFYEQRLVREQLAELTGQRLVGDYTTDDAQYKGLMDAGVSFARQWDLRPGVALSAEQMAALTSDIVWLVEKEVTLADGSVQKALVPQLYVRLRDDDLDGSGALLAGKDVEINIAGDLTNSGTIAGRDVVRLTAENVQNLGGRIAGDTVAATARNDLDNIGGIIAASSELVVTAGRDVHVTSATNTISGHQGDAVLAGSTMGRVAGLYLTGAEGTLAVGAGRDITLSAGQIANTGAAGNTLVQAGNNLLIGTITTGVNANLVWGANASAGKEGITRDTGSSITGAGNVALAAGGDLDARLANVQAGNALTVVAGRDLVNDASTFSAGNQLQASAGRDLNLVTSTASSASVTRKNGNLVTDTSTVVDKVAGMYVTGTGEGNVLLAQAGRDINLTAAVIANAGEKGITSLTAGNDLNLNTVGVASSHDVVRNADNYTKQSTSSEVGSQVTGAGDVSLKAGNDITLKAASIDATGALALSAGNDITLATGVEQTRTEEASKVKKKRTFSSKTTTKLDIVDTSNAIGNSLGAETIALSAGHNLSITGSSVLADQSLSLAAGNDLTIAAAVNTSKELHRTEVKQSGFLSGGGFGISYGTRTIAVDQERDAQTQSGLARSAIGALGGDLSLSAVNALKVGGSDLMAGADLNLVGKSVLIDPGKDDVKGKYEMRMTQDGFSLSLGGSVVSAIQTMQTMNSAASQAKDGRVTAMAAATAAMAARNAAKDVAKEGANVSISLTYGHSENQVTQTTASTTHSGSVLSANNINVAASGGGAESNLSIVGSDLNAKEDIRLHADNVVKLVAAQDTESQHTKTSSMSASAGIAATVGTSGTSFGITGSVSASKGHEDGSGTTQLNTHVNAGERLVISSGGDTVIRGAVASGGQVIADVKGNLLLESLQDMAKFDSKSQSISVSGTVGFGASVSGSYSQTSIHNDYASVQEQTGIRAGDGGFQINVGGNTDLKGAIISATEAGKADSSLTTATLTTDDIANYAISKGSSVGASGGYAVAGEGTQGKYQTNVGGKGGATGGMPAVAAVSENDSSSTRSGISGGTVVITDDAAQRALAGKGADDSIAGLNRDVTTGIDSSGKIANNLDKEAMRATMEVTKEFVKAAAPLAANLVGDFGTKKQQAAKQEMDRSNQLAQEARANGDEASAKHYQLMADQAQASYESWGDNGANRIALHAGTQGLIGALAGGGMGAASGAAGVVGGNLGQQWGKELAESEADRRQLNDVDRAALVNNYQQLFASVGGAVGGLVVAGAGGQSGSDALSTAINSSESATTVDLFNRQLHQDKDPNKDERKRIQKDLAPAYAAAHPGMTVEQATQILADQLLRQVDLVAGSKGGWNQDAANYLKNYAIAHQGENVGQDQWGNSVPLFANYAGYQRNDATIFSASPQTDMPPKKLGVDAVRDYFSGLYKGVGDTLLRPIDTLWNSAKGLYGMVIDPVGAAATLQEHSRMIVKEGGDGNFVPAGMQTGTDIGGTIVGSAFGAVVGGATSKLVSFKPSIASRGALEDSSKLVDLNASEIAGPYSLLSAKPEVVGPFSPLYTGEATRLISGVVVVERRSGTVYNGTVDLGPTIDRIQAGGSYPHRNDGSVFKNRPPPSNPSSPALPVQQAGYYTEYVVPTPNVTPGPQRIVVGKGGDMYYTPDHYDSFIPLKK